MVCTTVEDNKIVIMDLVCHNYDFFFQSYNGFLCHRVIMTFDLVSHNNDLSHNYKLACHYSDCFVITEQNLNSK